MPNTNLDKRKLDREKYPKKLQEKLKELERKKTKELDERKKYTVVRGDQA